MSVGVLLDTNIIVANSLSQVEVTIYLDELMAQGRELHICDQNLFEFWVVATRPTANNGLGLSPSAAAEKIRILRNAYSHLPNPSDLLDRWVSLCEKYRLIGKAGHDARLAAYMLGYGMTEIVTFDGSVFSRIPSINPIMPPL